MIDFYHLLAELKNNESATRSTNNQEYLFAEAKAYIDQHFSDQYINFDKLAFSCGMSKDYFRKKFKAVFGDSPLQYTMLLKIKLARELLVAPKVAINEITEQCGFEDANYFTRFFRQHTGMTPTQYRLHFKSR